MFTFEAAEERQQLQPQLQHAVLGEHGQGLYPLSFQRLECIAYSGVHLDNVIPHCKATLTMIKPSAVENTGSLCSAVVSARVT